MMSNLRPAPQLLLQPCFSQSKSKPTAADFFSGQINGLNNSNQKIFGGKLSKLPCRHQSNSSSAGCVAFSVPISPYSISFMCECEVWTPVSNVNVLFIIFLSAVLSVVMTVNQGRKLHTETQEKQRERDVCDGCKGDKYTVQERCSEIGVGVDMKKRCL
ncbi:hypothetical protein ILYODFUR_017178 [Ilyodon furcidens]|uniref:Uncharacterized protein n=1 Tax=Ilyodon furcidens TaxID=33524 RepID=A0ABV0T0Z7_9TELE